VNYKKTSGAAVPVLVILFLVFALCVPAYASDGFDADNMFEYRPGPPAYELVAQSGVVEGGGFDYGEFDDLDEVDDFEGDTGGPGIIADPIEPFNRAMFVVNDKLYFWVLKPAARGYSAVVPEGGRVAVKRFFTNLTTPVRFVNSALQFKFKRAGTELERFVINTTVGLLGFFDPARDRWGIYLVREDFGQTLGRYGAGPGFFITWPVFGPSSVRDTVGLVFDFFLDPVNYLFPSDGWTAFGVRAYERVNATSLTIGMYEDLKRDAIDPYSFIRDAYHQHREKLVAE